jgi:hypothetical protein
MKNAKNILLATIMTCAAAVPSLSAQQPAQEEKTHEFSVAIGDSVMIKRECDRYLTGETPSVWVWDKVHTVYQLGTKRFPDGVLLMDIYSWISEECLIPVNGHAQEAAAKAAVEQASEREAWEQAKLEGRDPETAARAVRETDAVKEEPAPQLEEKNEPVEEAVAEEAVKEEAVEETHSADEPAHRQNYHRFSIGVRGGAASLLHQADNGKWRCGGDAVLDLQYAHYWVKENRPVDLGLIVGLGIGYAQSSFNANPNADTSIVDSDNMKIDYSIRADEVKEHDGQLQLEVPVMFSLIHDNGLFFNVGPKLMVPVYTPYRQTLSRNENTQVSAYIPELGVTFINDEILGKLNDSNYSQQGSDYKNRFTINVMLSAEIGYEWILKSGNSLGLGAFANYSVYNSFKNNPQNRTLIELTTAPSGTDDAAFVVNPATQSYAKGLGFFDAGIKVAYHFNFPKKDAKAKDQGFREQQTRDY